jgi:hypothetical protein
MVDERGTNARGQRVPCRARAAIVGFSDDRRLVVSVVLVFVFVLKIFFVFVVVGVSRRRRIAHDYGYFHHTVHAIVAAFIPSSDRR